MKLAYVVGHDHSMKTMFDREPGYMSTSSANLADIHVFIGGADINPEFYKQKPHPKTHSNIFSDERDVKHWNEYKNRGKIFVGICRGAQFLNAVNGGKLWQHVEGHLGSHTLIDLFTNTELLVTSTHHQMMRVGPDGEVLAIAHKATLKQDDTEMNGTEEFDTEVVWYPKSSSFCFQPHPEYDSKTTKEYFFNLLNRIL